MARRNAFTREWLRTDTFLGPNLSAKQRRQLRALCQKFFNAGVRLQTGKQGGDDERDRVGR